MAKYTKKTFKPGPKKVATKGKSITFPIHKGTPPTYKGIVLPSECCGYPEMMGTGKPCKGCPDIDEPPDFEKPKSFDLTSLLKTIDAVRSPTMTFAETHETYWDKLEDKWPT